MSAIKSVNAGYTAMPRLTNPDLPAAQGLYDPAFEHDSCGVGFIADMKNRKSHANVQQGLQILHNLDHRGAVGADPKLGDGPVKHRRGSLADPDHVHPALGQAAHQSFLEPRAMLAPIAADR